MDELTVEADGDRQFDDARVVVERLGVELRVDEIFFTGETDSIRLVLQRHVLCPHKNINRLGPFL